MGVPRGLRAVRRPVIACVVAALALVCLGACGGDDASGSARAIIGSPHEDNVCGVVWDVQWRLASRVRGATPDALDLSRYPLSPEGVFLSPAGTTCTDAIAAGLTALCAPCDENPGDCEPLVRALFREVPASCSRCGDLVCYRDETEASCPPDCGHSCGDDLCSAAESALGCPLDCAEPCGDGFCGGGEDPQSCPADCNFGAGDGICEPGETPETSPQDCGFATCGDRFCQSYETALRCPEDCCFPTVCGGDWRPRCRGADAIEVCLESGLSQCPELVASETCAHGCIDDDELGARCRGCAERVEATFAGARAACDPDTPPTCEGPGVWTCAPLPGGDDCGYRTWSACPDDTRCVGGVCTR